MFVCLCSWCVDIDHIEKAIADLGAQAPHRRAKALLSHRIVGRTPSLIMFSFLSHVVLSSTLFCNNLEGVTCAATVFEILKDNKFG